MHGHGINPSAKIPSASRVARIVVGPDIRLVRILLLLLGVSVFEDALDSEGLTVNSSGEIIIE
jgi:hypothetical protein